LGGGLILLGVGHRRHTFKQSSQIGAAARERTSEDAGATHAPKRDSYGMSTTLRLPIQGELPSLDGATGWFNSDPLTPASLRGRPVLVQFWTFTCINWLRTLPYVRRWFDKYRHDGLVVLGVHTPEFDVEHSLENVGRAAAELEIGYPIALDSDYKIWRAFGNRYWPALYFADADGQIRHHRFGEGQYESSEIVIQRLLEAAGADRVNGELASLDPQGIEAAADWDHLRSPETYLGYDRAENFASPGGAVTDLPIDYSPPEELHLNRWALRGEWTIGSQAAVPSANGGRIIHRFHARDVNLVLAPAEDGQPVRFRVLLDGEPPGSAHGVDVDARGDGVVTEPRCYQLIRQSSPFAERTFEVTFLGAGVRAYVFTFG
jgi:thiol-disulfide isomerase/thioredoxin